MEKDYSLLMPFDLEAAKRGELVLFTEEAARCDVFVAGSPSGTHCFSKPNGALYLANENNVRMAPLAWVEGRPVYKGDVLFGHWKGSWPSGYVITGQENGVPVGYRKGIERQTLGSRLSDDGDYSWIPPKVKREGFVLLHNNGLGETIVRCGKIYKSIDDAEAVRSKIGEVDGVIACVRIEWDEPATNP